MSLPSLVMLAVILPLVIMASFSLMVINGVVGEGFCNAQSSGGMLRVLVARTRKALSPHGSIQSSSAS